MNNTLDRNEWIINRIEAVSKEIQNIKKQMDGKSDSSVFAMQTAQIHKKIAELRQEWILLEKSIQKNDAMNEKKILELLKKVQQEIEKVQPIAEKITQKQIEEYKKSSDEERKIFQQEICKMNATYTIEKIKICQDEYEGKLQEENQQIKILQKTLIKVAAQNKELLEKTNKLVVQALNEQERKYEQLIDDKLKVLKDEIDNKIQQLKIDELKGKIVIHEEKIATIESLNQKKMDKLRKEEEKFILKTMEEKNIPKQIKNVQEKVKAFSNQLDSLEAVTAKSSEENMKKMKDYIEHRILRMKYAITIEKLNEEIDLLKNELDNIKKQRGFHINNQVLEELVTNEINKVLSSSNPQKIKEHQKEKLKTNFDIQINKQNTTMEPITQKNNTKIKKRNHTTKSQILNTWETKSKK